MDSILDIASSWSFWDREPPASVPRKVSLPTELRPSICLVIQGVRRCGKSTLMAQLLGRHDLDPQRCAFVNFEDPRLARNLEFETLTQLVEAWENRHPEGPLYFFLDEIQVVEGWEKWLRSQLDRSDRNHFVVTGSSATMLSGELSTALTGRHITVELFPFSFEERGVDLEEYLETGGFPATSSMERRDGDLLLRQYFSDIVERDVRERAGARSAQPVRQLAQMLLESAGSELSMRRAGGAIGIAVETASGYVEACKSAYLVFECPYFAYSERKRANRNSKFYPIDTGLPRVVTTPGGRDAGKSLECATFLRLRRVYDEVYYWRDGGEVDFVVLDGRTAIPIQVTWSEPKPRHEKGLEDFYERHPHAGEAVYVTAETFDQL